jgi:signal transduction histidine kinase
MYSAFVSIVAASVLLQVVAIVWAVRLIRITKTSKAWLVIALAMLAMAIRRITVLVSVMMRPNTLDVTDVFSEAIGLVIAILLLVGVAAIGHMFGTLQRSSETTQRTRELLETQVQQRTADLLKAHEKLQVEFAQRARVEEALRDEHLHLRHVLEICESDQRLLAYEIHDGFVQPATAALMNLQASLSVFLTDPDKALENVVRGLQTLQESLSQVRWLISGLRPVVLEELGLVAAVDKLVSDSEKRTEVQIIWTHETHFDRLAPTLELSLFRIIQEGLRNSVRYSESDRVEVALTQTDRTICLRIQDWGCGFDAAAPRFNHFGLESIQERARLFAGTARIQSAPGKGTCITVEVPLVEKEAEMQANPAGEELVSQGHHP